MTTTGTDAALPLVDDARRFDPNDPKPSWRGWIHAGTFPLATAAGIVLIVLAQGGTAKIGAAVFTLTSMLLFGVSAVYHRFTWGPRAKRLLKRFDHANIFLLIAGTYTPIALVGLEPAKATLLLALVWSGALLGIVFRVFWVGAPRWLYTPLYVLLGWGALIYIGDLFAADVAMMTLVLVGGVLYTAGALVYALKRPNPWRGRFGFHEIFHTCTVLAFLCQWAGVLVVSLDPPVF